MSKRHDSIGVKQVIPYEWIRKTANLVLAGMSAKEVRQELHAALVAQGKHAQRGERSSWTRTFLVNNLMAVWPSPPVELTAFRDRALCTLRDYPDHELVTHWAMISSVYPFWFNTARQTGRLLNLQAQTTQAQIVSRLKEQYGDRQTVSRYARFVVRSFVDWGVLKDAGTAGCYENANPVSGLNRHLTTLLLEAALLATPEGKAPLTLLLGHPAFFPFHLAAMSGESFIDDSGCLQLARYGFGDQFLALRCGRVTN